MNQIRLLAFAQARDVLGFSETIIGLAGGETAREIVNNLSAEVPIDRWRVALDCEYVEWDALVAGATEMAVIPPVSGG